MILQRLYELGAPTMCHIIGHGDLDATEVPLEDASRPIHSMCNAVLLMCIPGRLAYYESATINGSYVYHRRPAAAYHFPTQLPVNHRRIMIQPVARQHFIFTLFCSVAIVLL